MNPEPTVAQVYLSKAHQLLNEDFMPRIGQCVNELSEEEIWWRPNDSSNSIGNILMHLSGNVRQWIISAVGQTEDVRVRDLEFSEQGPVPKADLLVKLESTVREATQVLQNLDPEALLEMRHIQVYEMNVLQAVFHVIEHFSGHTGQIIYITKLLKDKGCRFYDL